MKICVLVKQVADKNDEINLNEDKLSINESNFNLTTNESDNYAIEEALLLKEKYNAEVVICSFGKESAKQVIKDALSKGADRGLLIENDTNHDYDILNVSKLIKNSIFEEKFDIVLSGLQSDDQGNGQLGVLLAEHLNMSHASLVMETNFNPDTNTIKVKRELENGWFQWSNIDLPTSLTIQSGINKPRYASLRGIMMMKKKTIDTIKVSELSSNSEFKINLKSLYVPQKTKETIKIEGSDDEIADKIINVLKNELGLI
tara:strand:- start:1149 stop:1925 length:777 start_codon:yes stop_codon:yes gene_type:complete